MISKLFNVRMAVLSAMVLAMAGCSSKVTSDNYAKIQEGESESDVTALLGSPTTTETTTTLAGSGSKEIWKDGDKTITLFVIAGKVVAMDKSGF